MGKVLKVLGVLIAIPLLAFMVFCAYDMMVPKICVVYLDNGLSEGVKVKIDGQAPIMVIAHAISRQELKQGSHKIEVLNNQDKLIDSAEFTYKERTVGDKTKYVFNIKSSNRYAEYARAYGREEEKEPRKAVVQEHFFESSVQLMELCDVFPKSIPVRKGSGGGRRVILAHDPIHKDYPCCRKLWKSIREK